MFEHADRDATPAVARRAPLPGARNKPTRTGDLGPAARAAHPTLPPTQVAYLQRALGNRAAGRLVAARSTSGQSMPPIQRYQDLGDGLVGFTENEQPRPTLTGKFPSEPDYDFKRRADLDDAHPSYTVYQRTPKVKGPALVTMSPQEVELRKKEQAARTAQTALFDADWRGSEPGTFEFVANYLYAEVPNKQPIWDQVWSVTVSGDDVNRTLRKFDRRALLTTLIKSGLDFSWPAEAPTALEMTTVDHARGPIGIGFHTTLGPPATVLTSARARPKGAQPGWGGIRQPMQVPMFRKTYALDADWNPLGHFLEDHGPAYRRGNQDNELLSTVSIATQTHATVRFPLWNKTRPGAEVMVGNAKTFKMEVYLYAVEVSEGFNTSKLQGSNAFAEIATTSIFSDRVIGYSKLTRWHDPDPSEGYATADFRYELEPMTRNPTYRKSAVRERVYAAAEAAVAAEQAASATKHSSR